MHNSRLEYGKIISFSMYFSQHPSVCGVSETDFNTYFLSQVSNRLGVNDAWHAIIELHNTMLFDLTSLTHCLVGLPLKKLFCADGDTLRAIDGSAEFVRAFSWVSDFV